MSTDRLAHDMRRLLAEAGLRGSFLVRDLASGNQIGLEPDVDYPSASLVKVALALSVAERIRTGALDPVMPIDVEPGGVSTPGLMGVSRFRHASRIALEDLLYLSTAVSDNSAADALFDLVPPVEVEQDLRAAGITGITVRHRMGVLAETPVEALDTDQVHLAHALAIGAATAGAGHPVPQLDVSRANTGTATAFVDLLQEIWSPVRLHPAAAQPVRRLLAHNVVRQRLAADFAADQSRWSSKTGTLLNLRHEIGVVEHDDGQVLAVAALTQSSVPAAAQPAAEARIGQVARALHDHLRAGRRTPRS